MQLSTLGATDALPRGVTVAIGNFDGVHRGHKSVLELARQAGDPVIVLTFEPHPKAVLAPGAAPFRLSTPTAKAHALQQAGATAVVAARFDLDLARTSAPDFVEQALVEGLGARRVVVGHDYRFGRGREGDVGLLASLSEHYDFELLVAPEFADRNGERFSSSQLRRLIAAGDLVAASRALGRVWSVEGDAAATANGVELAFGPIQNLPSGAYLVSVTQDRRAARGVAVFDDGALDLAGLAQPGPVEVRVLQALDAASSRSWTSSAERLISVA